MDFFTADWMSEMELVDAAFIPKWQMMNPVDASVENLDANHFSPASYGTDPAPRSTTYEVSETDIYLPGQLLLKNKDFYSRNTQKAKMIAFGDASATANSTIVKIEADAGSLEEMSFEDPIISPNSIQKVYAALEYGETVKRSITRTTLQAQQDHVVAERKRREKLSELFISLSTMIPGLKKLDKASILGGTIEYLKQLEGRLKTLEKQQRKRKNEETFVSAYANKQPRLSLNDHMDTSSSDDTNLDQSVPEIEVTSSCDGNVLLRVYCSKRTGVIKEILCEVEKLGLCIINSCAMPFGDTTLHISVMAQMNEDFCLFEESLEEKVRQAILKLL